MIIRILSSSASFNAVNYNTGKMDQGKGELTLTSGFGSLQGLEQWRPEDYRNYLKMLAAQNKRVKAPQFHAALSAEGKTVDKQALTEIAVSWLKEMGYGSQPYLIIFHKDTANNHVHIVSCRIGRDGKKISSDFENIRAIEKLNKVLSMDEKQNAEAAIAKALSYCFATKAQFLMILESKGYIIKESGDKLEVIRSGLKQAEIELVEVEKRLNKNSPDLKRLSQLKALFHKYAAVYDTGLRPNTIPLPGNYSQVIKGFTSDFAACLKEKHGLELVFHSKEGKPVYGYSVIDHAGKAVCKGGEILPLKELLSIKAREKEPAKDESIDEAEITKTAINNESKTYYSALLKAVIYNYPDLRQGLHHQGLNIIHNGDQFILADYSSRAFFNIDDLLNEDESAELKRHFGQYRELENEIDRQYDYIAPVNLADDTGDSYSGLCSYYKGKYITYTDKKPITMNPFAIKESEYNIEKKDFLCTLICLLWKGAEGVNSPVERDVIAHTISAYFSHHFAEKKAKLKFDTFYEFALEKIPQIKAEEQIVFDHDEFRYVLKKFYKGGEFATILNEQADESLFSERFIVFEIDSIKEHKILFPIVTLIIMDVFIQKMRYRKDRRKTLIVEEAWKAIASPLMAGYLLYLYKTVRKFWGEAIVVTQDLGDIIGNAVVKDSIINNSDTVCLLDQTKFKDNYKEIAALLSINETERKKIFTINQLDNKNNRGRFKEVYIRRGSVGEVYGVEVSLHQYLCYTTEKPEKTAVENYTNAYGSYPAGLDAFVHDLQNSRLPLSEFVSRVNQAGKPIINL